MTSHNKSDRNSKKLTFPVNIGSDHIRGSINAPVTIVEYGDYECPYTGMAYPVVKEIMKQFGDKIYFVFRNFPLNDIHPRKKFSRHVRWSSSLLFALMTQKHLQG